MRGDGGGGVREEEATKITRLPDLQGGGGRWGEMSWEGAATKIIRSSKSDKSEAKKMNKCGAGNKYF